MTKDKHGGSDLSLLRAGYGIVPKCKPDYAEPGKHGKVDIEDLKVTFTDSEAISEATRCMKCVDAPCQKACPANVDVRKFMQSISTGNYYGAAKAILSDNPMGWTCGTICPSADLCAGACNLKATAAGSVRVRELQSFAISEFAKMKAPQKIVPVVTKTEEMIALIGAGPASLTCATYLARMGFKNITIFEKRSLAGGVVSWEVPGARLPKERVQWEISQVQELGVRFKFGVSFPHDINLETLKAEGYKAVFLGVGLQQSKFDPVFQAASSVSGILNAKDFLVQYSTATKDFARDVTKPKLSGNVTVIGVGDTAMDCVLAAYDCGASNVTVVFRRGFPQMRAREEEFCSARNLGCDFIDWCKPTKVNVTDGNIASIEFVHTKLDNGKLVEVPNTRAVLECSTVILSFGVALEESLGLPVSSTSSLAVDTHTLQLKGYDNVWVGGDAAGKSIAVEAVNDGKVAAMEIGKHLNGEAKLQPYATVIDDIPLTTVCCGQEYLNPFGLASAPPATSIPMIARAFEAGWAFAVVKTYQLDKDLPTNLSCRIVSPHTLRTDSTPSTFMNIEQTTEKTATYWCNGIAELKKKYPKNRVIASCMAAENEQDWTELIKMTVAAGPDAIELNLSCPTGVHERGLGIAIGQKPEAVARVCGWVKAAAQGIPFYAKLTPNITDIRVIAEAAIKGGASGVTATNTVNSMIGIGALGNVWPNVRNHTSYGGLSGRSIRPMALYAVSRIANFMRGTQICATGGVESADTAATFLRCGAQIMQVSSALHTTDYSLIYDFTSGLQSIVFNTNKIVPTIKTVSDLVGSSLDNIVDFGKMDIKSQMVAKIELEDCLHCGKCYSTCGDCGYQAVSFVNRVPTVDVNKCTGCGLCVAGCPARCISFTDKPVPHIIDRGDHSTPL